jgi:transcriptional regulator with XRE-family HTH domain
MTTSSTPAGRGPGDRTRLAATLREARHKAGLTGTVAGERAGMSHSKVSKIERGFLLPSVDDVAALCHAYGITENERGDLIALAEGLRLEASAKVILSRGIAEMQRRIGQLEAASTLIRGFQPTIVDGLLQTEAYMRLVFGVSGPQAVSEQEADSAVRARLDRQRLLDDETKQFVLIMSEGALRWQAGSPTLMAEQAEAIAAATKRPNLRFGIIPWTTSVDRFPIHGFHVYDEDAVIVGTLTATATITGAADIATYLDQFAAIEGLATFGDAAREHLARVADEYRQLETSHPNG